MPRKRQKKMRLGLPAYRHDLQATDHYTRADRFARAAVETAQDLHCTTALKKIQAAAKELGQGDAHMASGARANTPAHKRNYAGREAAIESLDAARDQLRVVCFRRG